jgi:hypothetical protein
MQMVVPGVPVIVPMVVAAGMSMRVTMAAVIMIVAGARVLVSMRMVMVMARMLVVVFVGDAAVMLVRLVRHEEIRSVKVEARTRHYGLDA